MDYFPLVQTQRDHVFFIIQDYIQLLVTERENNAGLKKAKFYFSIWKNPETVEEWCNGLALLRTQGPILLICYFVLSRLWLQFLLFPRGRQGISIMFAFQVSGWRKSLEMIEAKVTGPCLLRKFPPNCHSIHLFTCVLAAIIMHKKC